MQGQAIPEPGMPEAGKVFTKELKGLGMDVTLYNEDGGTIDMNDLANEALIEERKVNSAIRNLTAPREEEKPETEEVSSDVASEQAAEEGLSIGTGPSSGDLD